MAQESPDTVQIQRQVPPLSKSNDVLGYVWEPLTMTYTDSDTNCGYEEGVRLNLSNSQLLTRKICEAKPSSTVKNERERQRDREEGERSQRQQTLTSCIPTRESRRQSSKAGANICEGETGRPVTPYSDPRKLADLFLYSWTHWLLDTTRLP